ncbi:LOW QUALITY PROTEIN: galactosylgalactosylxylosylprotein 3-beta-glucuronosyltransferase S [Drosophila eugracilis]|uniref:LOW QUALITY PROTEIN: galactosylgalactosylxylosylprotein 3-beta-glucuronosyltransferase S n=1 Tax=Drosophila eugracilis TaxID=29029 RepID=UPI001BD974B7|nr:LOW QUALITY PROTEIN: galactosylgalactosylxylosylprotein 3-beta-glucuronosyltransferase S [Drosophila eugracilis]
MSSAHYQALESQTSDEDNEDIERRQHPNHPRSTTVKTTAPHPMVRKGAVARRRCLLPLAGGALFFIAFCYFTLSGETRITLGLGGGSEDSEEGSHRGLDSIHFRPLNESLHICSESYEDRRQFMQDKPQSDYGLLPIIYFVTPTYPRREQIPELTRLAHTLLHVPRLHWLVADDQEKCNDFLDTLLNRFGIPFTHMVSPMPIKFRNEKPAPRGVANRRAALQWLRQHNLTNGVLYFGDDDNTYDLRLFSEIRKTQRVSMFPVGLIADYGVSGPVVRRGKVVGFLDSWVAGRRWPVDMAGFAVNLEYMAQYPYVNMPYKPGYEEDLFLRSIDLQMNLIEPRGNNCTEILVWHTQTKSKKMGMVRLESKYLDERSNLGALLLNLKLMGVASTTENEGRNALISKNGKEKAHSYFLS